MGTAELVRAAGHRGRPTSTATAARTGSTYSAAEHRAVREGVGLFDQSSFGEVLVQGADAEVVLNRICANDIAGAGWQDRLHPMAQRARRYRGRPHGHARSGEPVPDRDGGGDARRATLAWLQRQIAEARARRRVRRHLGLCGTGRHGAALPRAAVATLTDADLSNEAFPFGTSQVIDLGYARIRARSRITYVGELGWELYVPTEFVQSVFDAIVDAGAAFGLRLAGYHAMNSLRMEKAYRHWGHDITDEDTPLEAGLGFAVAWSKPGGFIGREALLRQRERGVTATAGSARAADDPEAALSQRADLARRRAGRANHLRHVRPHGRQAARDGLCRGGGRKSRASTSRADALRSRSRAGAYRPSPRSRLSMIQRTPACETPGR